MQGQVGNQRTQRFWLTSITKKSTEDRATGGRILVQRHCHLQCSIELIDAPSIGDNYVSNRPLAMTSTNSLKKNGANSTAVQFRRCGTPSFLLSSRVADARSNERPLHSTSQPANIAQRNRVPEETDARTVITSFDIVMEKALN